MCEGCLRTTQEIARWPYADTPERLDILQLLRERRRAVGRTSVGGQSAAAARQSERCLIMTILDSLLASRPVLLADGGMGTGLFALGPVDGRQPRAVERAASGADRRGASRLRRGRLRHHPHQQLRRQPASAEAAPGPGPRRRAEPAAARIARGVADAADRPVVVAGSMGPTGELIVPLGALTIDEATAAFAEQAQALGRGRRRRALDRDHVLGRGGRGRGRWGR